MCLVLVHNAIISTVVLPHFVKRCIIVVLLLRCNFGNCMHMHHYCVCISSILHDPSLALGYCNVDMGGRRGSRRHCLMQRRGFRTPAYHEAPATRELHVDVILGTNAIHSARTHIRLPKCAYSCVEGSTGLHTAVNSSDYFSPFLLRHRPCVLTYAQRAICLLCNRHEVLFLCEQGQHSKHGVSCPSRNR